MHYLPFNHFFGDTKLLQSFALKACFLGVTLSLAACGGGNSSSDEASNSPVKTDPKPAEPVFKPTQPTVLENGFSYVSDPLAYIKANKTYAVSYWVDQNPLELSMYRVFELQNDQWLSTTYATSNNKTNVWQKQETSRLVFSKKDNQWIEINNDMQASQGSEGTAGIKTILMSDAQGITYYSLIEKDLSNETLAGGLTTGFGNGITLPNVVKTAKFSNGAKAYHWIYDVPDASYAIQRTKVIDFFGSNSYKLHPIYNCATPVSSCTNKVKTVNNAVSSQAWFMNTGKNANIQLFANNIAKLQFTDPETKVSGTENLSYKLIAATSNTPTYILFEKTNAASQQALAKYFGVNNGQFAWYEYNNQVVAGGYQAPIVGEVGQSNLYNQVAINDILTKWQPAKSPVLN